MEVTIKDIARLAGVTHSTVSKALNGEKGVSEKTRQKIVLLAAQMNYRPNLAARRLSDKKADSLGLIWPQKEEVFYFHLCASIQMLARKRKISALMSMDDPEWALQVFNEHFVDMVVLWAEPGWHPSEEFERQRTDFSGELIILGGGRLQNVHRISIDRKGSIFLAVQHLSEMGHKRIAYVGGESDKQLGFLKGILEFKMENHPDIVTSIEDPEKLTPDWFKSVLSSERSPTAFVADCQETLTKLLQFCRLFHLSVPQDISIVAYDHIPEMEALDISITSVGPSIKEMSEAILNIYRDSRESPGQYQDICMKAELAVRNSVKDLTRV